MSSSIGWRIISTVLRTGTMAPFVRAGMTRAWLHSNSEGAWGVFPGEERDYWDTLLTQWHELKHKTDRDAFLRTHRDVKPRDIAAKEKLDPDQLIHLARKEAQIQVMLGVIQDLAEAYDEEQYDECLEMLATEAPTPLRILNPSGSAMLQLDDINLEMEILDPDLSDTIKTGYPNLDDDYALRPGHLVTIIGRQKAGKSLVANEMALGTWQHGWTSVFYTVELDPSVIRQRTYAFGAQVSLSRISQGSLHTDEADRVSAFHRDLRAEKSARLYISSKTRMITMDDIAQEYEQLKPHIIFIDGFYFMKDRITGRTATDWEANENLAAELKQFAVENDVAVLVTTQSQEKQQSKSKKLGIEARTIMGGTGLLKASDLVLGLDRDGNLRLLHEINSRYTSVSNYHFEWDWEKLQRTNRTSPGSKVSQVTKALGLG